MSAANPIEVLSDDDEITMVGPNENETKIQTFLEFSGSSNRDYAIKVLKEFNFDVEEAVTRGLDTLDVAKLPETQIVKPDVKIKSSHHQHDTDKTANTKLNNQNSFSAEWHACFEKSPDRFVDPDFPPIESSLDGRKRTAQEKVVRCVCGLPATAKSVQSDGPNYGRFYLCCGKARQRVKRQNQCKFFQWDDASGSKGAGYATRYSLMSWKYFGDNHILVNGNFSSDDVRQGAVGNCWFLSALAVVAEKDYLIKQLLPHRELNDKGCYQINLCLDGKWTPVIVDSHLPVVHGGRVVDPLRGGTSLCEDSASSIHTAFCAVPSGQLWPALIEKAYAKAHGSYQQLSGGFIQEGFQDITGAPTETLIFDGTIWDFDSLWARLMSFYQAGFLLGVATSRGGDGLVGGHAYSVLEVIELNDMVVGKQQSMKDFLKGPQPKKKQRTTVRLVRIRNPWGKKEWKGEWSVNSEQWTRALRKRLGEKSFAKGDGTFFMSYGDMLQRFHHIDVAKCHKDWRYSSFDGCFLPGAQNALKSTSHCFQLSAMESSFAFISVIQPKKRANTKSQYWYSDPSIVVLKQNRVQSGNWEGESVQLSGRMRSSTFELFLDSSYVYCVIPFSCKSDMQSPFRLACYSAKDIDVAPVAPHHLHSKAALAHIHRTLLQDERRLQYTIAPACVVVCTHGNRCLYFVAVNGSESLVSLRLCVKLQKGLLVSYGLSGDVSDVPPRSQKIIMAVSGDGTSTAAAVSLDFTYASDAVKVGATRNEEARNPKNYCLGTPMQLSMLGELLSTTSVQERVCNKGGDRIETHQWLSQIGRSP